MQPLRFQNFPDLAAAADATVRVRHIRSGTRILIGCLQPENEAGSDDDQRPTGIAGSRCERLLNGF
jgi:hypothetical protein